MKLEVFRSCLLGKNEENNCLQKHPFSLALRRLGRFAWRNRQKFHADEVKSVRNQVRSADWSTEKLHCLSYCLRMTDKRQKATKVK